MNISELQCGHIYRCTDRIVLYVFKIPSHSLSGTDYIRMESGEDDEFMVISPYDKVTGVIQILGTQQVITDWICRHPHDDAFEEILPQEKQLVSSMVR